MAQKTNSSLFQGARIRPYGERGYLLDQFRDIEAVCDRASAVNDSTRWF